MRVTKRRLARELRALMELETEFDLAVDAEAMKLERQAHTEFEKFHPEWRFLISLHHWSRALEGGWVNLPAYFEGETALPSDRISTMGTTLDLVAARNKFLRCVKESPARGRGYTRRHARRHTERHGALVTTGRSGRRVPSL